MRTAEEIQERIDVLRDVRDEFRFGKPSNLQYVHQLQQEILTLEWVLEGGN